MVYTEAEYLKKSQRERVMLNLLFGKIYNKNGFNDNIYHTPAEGKEPYDSVVCRFKNGIIQKNHIWEAKIRDADYDDILFEKIKYNSLKKIAKKYDAVECDIFYVSSHPSGTYVFNITQIEKDNKLKWIKQSHNISTVELWKGKTEKELVYLPISLAKKVDIKASDIDNEEKRIEEQKKMNSRDNKIKKIIGFSLDLDDE
jgi:hypothetical protein